MKKIILSFLCLTLCFSISYGQKIKDKVEAYRIAFFTERLELTAEEAKGFWPIYNEYQAELEKINQTFRQKAKGSIDLMTDAELEDFIERKFKQEEDKIALERKYFNRFKTVLPLRKVAKIPNVEQAFKAAILKRIREGRRSSGE